MEIKGVLIGVHLGGLPFEDSVGGQDLYMIPEVINNLLRSRMKVSMLTTSNFFSSATSDSRELPCHTRTFNPSVCDAISFLHCMMATVGLWQT